MKEVLSVSACSSMTLTSASGKNYWFRTCDIDTDIWQEGAHIVSFPKGSEIAFAQRGKEISNYGLIGITNDARDTWILDGVNEQGLAGGLLLLREGTSTDSPKSGYEGYVGMELVTKLLSSCSNVQQVIAAAEKIQVCSIWYEGQAVPATMHYFFTDVSGDEVILEASDNECPGIFKVYKKKDSIGVMTNSPIYPDHMDNLAWYIAASLELKCGLKGEIYESLIIGEKEVKGDANAKHFLKNNTFPASYCSYDRFVRLSVLKALNDSGRNFSDDKMLALGSGIMSSVYEPRSKGVFHYAGFDEKGRPIAQKDSCSQYLVMYDLTQRALYLRALDTVSFTEYKLENADAKNPVCYQVKHEGMAGIIKGN